MDRRVVELGGRGHAGVKLNLVNSVGKSNQKKKDYLALLEHTSYGTRIVCQREKYER